MSRQWSISCPILPSQTRIFPLRWGGIDAKENWHAYPIELSDIRTKRHGNVVLDILGFKRRTLEAGWRFAGIILTTNATVVYKLTAGEPSILNYRKTVKPLGPLQELDAAVAGVAGSAATVR